MGWGEQREDRCSGISGEVSKSFHKVDPRSSQVGDEKEDLLESRGAGSSKS